MKLVTQYQKDFRIESIRQITVTLICQIFESLFGPNTRVVVWTTVVTVVKEDGVRL